MNFRLKLIEFFQFAQIKIFTPHFIEIPYPIDKLYISKCRENLLNLNIENKYLSPHDILRIQYSQ